MKNIFIFGYYGFNNIGDEAILEAIVGQFRQQMPQVTLTALSYKAAETADRYGIMAVSRNRFVEVFRSIKKANLVMSGGGSILQDVTSSRSLMYYLGIIFLAKVFGRKVAFYGNGFGPITRPLNRWLVRQLINQVDLITVRDEESRQLMQALGIQRPITVTADAAFTLPLLQGRVASDKSHEPKKVGISVRSWKNQSIYLPAVAACADLLAHSGYEVCFLPMQPPADTRVSEEIMNQMTQQAAVIKVDETPSAMIRAISEMDFIIGMRLHALIFAAIAGVPMVGLSYEAKITSFLKLVQQPCAGEVETLDKDQLINTVLAFLKDQEQHKLNLMKQRDELCRKSAQNAALIQNFLLKEEPS
ncbi:polysaccharide pyruvyl transferase CsaB [Anoxynatronum sibiricum]|uniref:Polysaccharide pyruvyl transferase CsaB n=1 Tax=Anoxynatronum sibiricum TaxID=210623 RepID=A0ABU9VPM3_9CLOT